MSWENISVKKNLLKNTDSELFTRKSVHSEMCIVGYLDILGSKQRILEDNSDSSLNSVYNLYNSTQNLFKKLKGVEYYKDIKTRIFSDNIVIFYPLDSKAFKKLKLDNKIQNISVALSIINLLSSIFQIIAFSGLKWCVRGGISMGSIYNNGTLLWGKGLVQAYDIESNIATYPRVVVDKKLIETLSLSDNKKMLEESLIRVAEDGEYYVDFVAVMNLLSERPDVGMQIHEMFEKNFAELESDNEKVLDKYRWFVKTYANSMNNPELLENYPNLKFNL